MCSARSYSQNEKNKAEVVRRREENILQRVYELEMGGRRPVGRQKKRPGRKQRRRT